MAFNYFDYGLIIFLLVLGLFGFIKGFTQKILSLFSWGGAIILTFYLYPHAKPYVGAWIGNQLIGTIVTCGALFLVLLIIFKLITVKISTNIQKSSIGSLDRILGFLIGLLTGVVIISLISMVLSILPTRAYPDFMKKSTLWPFAERSGKYIQNLHPFKKGYEDTKKDAKKGINAMDFSAYKAKKKGGNETAYGKKDRRKLDDLMKGVD